MITGMSCSIRTMAITVLVAQPSDQLDEPLLLGRVHPGSRLVEQKEQGLGGHRPGDLQPTPVGVGQLGGKLILTEAGEAVAEERQRLARPVEDLLLLGVRAAVP